MNSLVTIHHIWGYVKSIGHKADNQILVHVTGLWRSPGFSRELLFLWGYGVLGILRPWLVLVKACWLRPVHAVHYYQGGARSCKKSAKTQSFC
jgi:hypothetical protein